ncbi:MAG: autotransporter domain-containing protein, partial [Planctomycetaceae bacterium]|nr:autotransporter domain-containing protein [Planctomycetaceae bacterium]
TGYAVLSGNNTYTGRTNVLDGALFIDGKVAGDVYVEERAGLGGNGKIGGNVLLADNSYYLWRFGATERDSDTLTIDGRLSIGQSVFFKPLTTLMSDEQIVNADGWTVIEYGELINRFAGVDSWSNPFYHFELDYDTLGVIKINGYRLDQPRALSDVVVTSAGMAQTKMWRTAFRQIQREWACDCPAAIQQIEANRSGAQFRGQNPATYRTAWMQFVGRGDHFESTYFKDQYSLQSYGAQFGVSLLSTCDHSFGIMFGREEGQLKNKSDKVENEDNYLGLYFAKRFQENVDFLAYIGGGWQKNHLDRFSNERAYAAAFNGSTFNFDFELGKRFYREPGSFLRPYFGVDVEIARLGSGNERTMDGLESNEIRNYGTTKFDQVFLKIGVDANRTWRMVDLYGGVNLNWNVAAPYAKSTIYYPYIDKSIASKSASFGRFSGALNIGLNWYITQRRNSAFYIDYQAEIHQDRKNSISAGTGVVGFFLRF